MTIDKIHSYLVHPGKHLDEQPPLVGTSVPGSGRLFEMLTDIFVKADTECNIQIMFVVEEEADQQNDCRDLILDYIRMPTKAAGRRIAAKLQSVTTKRSGLGLLFLMKGKQGNTHRLVISRFPADRGILAHEDANKLTVEFIERVFMKSATAYKSALYTGRSLTADFWHGHAIDRQINYARELSNYWIMEFLMSDFYTTAASGTKRLAIAFREAVRKAPDVDTKEELISAVRLLRGQSGRVVSGAGVVRRFNLSDRAATALQESFRREGLYEEEFRVTREELEREIPFRSVELDTGVTLSAFDAQFDDVFTQEQIDAAENRFRYTTEGRIVDKKLRKNR